MLKQFAVYAGMSPPERAVVLLLLGLAVGSFSSVLHYRLPRGLAFWSGRSQCPVCNHTLGPLELIPLLSFLWQRGKCRNCQAPISWRYPILELACGLLTAVVGYSLGWPAGMAVLVAWIAGVSLLGLSDRGEKAGPHSGEAGLSLAEVLVSLFIITIALLPTLDVMTLARHAGVAGQKRSLAIGLAQARISQLASIGETDISMIDAEAGVIYGSAMDTSLAPYRLQTQILPVPGLEARRVIVTVDCPTCGSKYGEAVPPVTLETVIRERVGP